MDQNNLKCVVGKCAKDEVAEIRLFDSIDKCSADCFKDEFLWLQDYVQPSKIRVLINSEGGSVIAGMSIYSLIASCPIETEGVIEGIAASMGSIIWSACDKLYMHDYSILMIHNPYVGGKCDDPNSQAIVDAFKGQLKTIYMKRFCMAEDEIAAIMDGKDGVDGTYFSAMDAARKGIICEANIIETPQTTRAQIEEEISAAMESRSAVDFEKIVAKVKTIDLEASQNVAPGAVLDSQEEGTNNPTQHNNKMNQEFQSVAALLGMDEATAQLSGVSAKITELMNAQAELVQIKAERDDLNGKVLAHEATIQNLQSNLDEANATLNNYKEAEAQRKAAEISAKLDKAIAAGKIAADTKAKWEDFFASNEELAQASLDAIPARVIVTEQIANDPQNQQEIEAKQKAIEEAQKKAEEAVAKVVGDDFKFNTFAPKED